MYVSCKINIRYVQVNAKDGGISDIKAGIIFEKKAMICLGITGTELDCETLESPSQS